MWSSHRVPLGGLRVAGVGGTLLSWRSDTGPARPGLAPAAHRTLLKAEVYYWVPQSQVHRGVCWPHQLKRCYEHVR